MVPTSCMGGGSGEKTLGQVCAQHSSHAEQMFAEGRGGVSTQEVPPGVCRLGESSCAQVPLKADHLNSWMPSLSCPPRFRTICKASYRQQAEMCPLALPRHPLAAPGHSLHLDLCPT